MNTIHPYLKYQFNKFSRLSLLGSVILMMAILLSIYHTQFQDVRLDDEKQDLDKIVRTSKLQAKAPIKNIMNQDVNNAFLDKHAFITLLENIQQAADQNSVSYNAVEYKPINIPEINVMSYQVNYPFTASYINLKKFLYAVLNPYKSSIVLTHIALYRDSSQTELLDGELQFTLYFRN